MTRDDSQTSIRLNSVVPCILVQQRNGHLTGCRFKPRNPNIPDITCVIPDISNYIPNPRLG